MLVVHKRVNIFFITAYSIVCIDNNCVEIHGTVMACGCSIMWDQSLYGTLCFWGPLFHGIFCYGDPFLG